VSGRDAVLSSGTVVTLPVKYSDRRLAVLSAARRSAMFRWADMDGGEYPGRTGRAPWFVTDTLTRDVRELDAHDGAALEVWREWGAIAHRRDGEYAVTALADLVAPLWATYAKATGREDAVLSMVNRILTGFES
jgi:hypothetical protein